MQAKMEQLKTRLYNFLRWSEKYTKTDMVYLAESGWWASLSKVIGIGSSLAITIGLANLIPPDIYGNYRFVLALAAIVGAFTLTGMGPAVVQAVARGYEGALKIGVWTKLRWSLGITAAAFVIAVYYYINDNLVLSSSMLIVGLLAPLQEGFDLYKQYLVGKKHFKTNAIYQAFKMPLLAITFISVLFLTNNVVLIVATFFALHAIINILLFSLTLITYRPNKSIDANTVTYSKHLSAMNIVSRLAGNLDSILLFHFLGAAPLAMYSIAKAPPKKLRESSTILKNLALPKLAQRDMRTLKRSVPEKALKMFGIGVLMAGVYFVIAPPLFTYIFPQYVDAIFYSQIIGLGLLTIPGGLYAQALVAHTRKQELYITKITTPIVRIILLVTLLPFWGIWGAIAAILFTNVFNLALNIFIFHRISTA